MADYDNNNRGVLFKNDRKETDKHPDYTGSINVGGTDYWLSAWIKKGQRGKFMSLSVKPKEDRNRNPNAGREQPASVQQMDDEIPF